MRNDILEEIDKLKLMVMLDMGGRTKTDLEMYQEWVDRMQGRHINSYCPEDWYPSNAKYAEYKSLKCLVDQLFYDKHGDNKKYDEHKPEIRKIIAEVVAMTLYIKEQIK